MNVHQRPIGLFDSGLGGLSVARELRRLMPAERLLYAADSRFCPYGTRPPEEIRARALAMAQTLVERGVRLLIVACNTATAVALEELRTRFTIPIIGLEPAVKPAVLLTRTGKIAVLATPRTAGSERLQRLIRRHAAAVEVTVIPAPGLVELVEVGEHDGEHVVACLRPLIEPLVARGVDTLVLGCTHYPFLRRAIAVAAEGKLTLVDSGEAIARRAWSLLSELGETAPPASEGGLDLHTTGDPSHVGAVASRLLGQTVTALPLVETVLSPLADQAPESAKLSEVWTVSTSAGA
jgi:glutamate racemase